MSEIDGRGAKESGLALALRFGSLMTLGLVAAFAFYWALLATAQVIAVRGGASREEIRAAVLWSTAIVFAVGFLPIVRFAVAELPTLAVDYAQRPREKYVMLALLALGGYVLFGL
jgi:hypothetical protein